MSQNKIQVAVVDDDKNFACALERLFRASGFEVCTYPSAEAYLAPAHSPEPDCLILDVQLGGMSGIELQRRLREMGARAPIIFVTAHDASGVRDEAESGGCAAYFSKPVARKPIIEAIKQAVHQTQKSFPERSNRSVDPNESCQ